MISFLGNLPPEILLKIFRDLRGNSLIRLSRVCRNFNETIGTSRELMDKIRVKASANAESQSFSDLDKVLCRSLRKYEHISFINIQADDDTCTDFVKKYTVWKSMKLQTCHFRSIKSKLAFLSMVSEHLEEVEFENIIIDQMGGFVQRQQVVPVQFPKLLKLKCGNQTADVVSCSNLKVLDLSMASQNRIHQLLKTNPGLEEFTTTYEVLDAIFKKELISEMGINLKLKKLRLLRHHSTEPIDSISNRNFQTFLRSQSDTLEEVNIDWFSGRPKRRSTGTDWDWGPSFRRIRGEGHVRAVPNNPVLVFHRRRFVDDDFNPTDDICVRALTTIFQEFKVIRKLIVSDKQGFLAETSCPSVTVLNLVANLNITELRLRFEKAPLSDVLFEKLVTACPNLKSLFVHEMDQALLECCAKKLKHIESIFALSFKVNCLPSEKVKFKKLQRVTFCECIVKNHPELNDKKLSEQKSAVLQMITSD